MSPVWKKHGAVIYMKEEYSVTPYGVEDNGRKVKETFYILDTKLGAQKGQRRGE
jgi:hypothetical protein